MGRKNTTLRTKKGVVVVVVVVVVVHLFSPTIEKVLEQLIIACSEGIKSTQPDIKIPADIEQLKSTPIMHGSIATNLKERWWWWWFLRSKHIMWF